MTTENIKCDNFISGMSLWKQSWLHSYNRLLWALNYSLYESMHRETMVSFLKTSIHSFSGRLFTNLVTCSYISEISSSLCPSRTFWKLRKSIFSHFKMFCYNFSHSSSIDNNTSIICTHNVRPDNTSLHSVHIYIFYLRFRLHAYCVFMHTF